MWAYFNIASILKNEGASMNISGSVNPGEFDFMGSKITFTSPALVTGTIVNIGGTIEISADAKGEFLTQCSRCGKEISQQTCDQIEQGRFACTVRAEQTVDRTTFERHRQIVYRRSLSSGIAEC